MWGIKETKLISLKKRFEEFLKCKISNFNKFRGSEYRFLWIFALFGMVKFSKSTKFIAPKMSKTAVLQLLDSPKLISRKIWMTENSAISTLCLKYCTSQIGTWKCSILNSQMSKYFHFCSWLYPIYEIKLNTEFQ